MTNTMGLYKYLLVAFETGDSSNSTNEVPANTTIYYYEKARRKNVTLGLKAVNQCGQQSNISKPLPLGVEDRAGTCI